MHRAENLRVLCVNIIWLAICGIFLRAILIHGQGPWKWPMLLISLAVGWYVTAVIFTVILDDDPSYHFPEYIFALLITPYHILAIPIVRISENEQQTYSIGYWRALMSPIMAVRLMVMLFRESVVRPAKRERINEWEISKRE